MREVTRRTALKTAGVVTAAAALGVSVTPAAPIETEPRWDVWFRGQQLLGPRTLAAEAIRPLVWDFTPLDQLVDTRTDQYWIQLTGYRQPDSGETRLALQFGHGPFDAGDQTVEWLPGREPGLRLVSACPLAITFADSLAGAAMPCQATLPFAVTALRHRDKATHAETLAHVLLHVCSPDGREALGLDLWPTMAQMPSTALIDRQALPIRWRRVPPPDERADAYASHAHRLHVAYVDACCGDACAKYAAAVAAHQLHVAYVDACCGDACAKYAAAAAAAQ